MYGYGKKTGGTKKASTKKKMAPSKPARKPAKKKATSKPRKK